MPRRFPTQLSRSFFIVLTAILMAAMAAWGSSNPVLDVPIIVLVNDGEENSIRRTSGISQQALVEVRDQMARQGYEVKTEEMLAAALDWNLDGRRGTSELLRLAYAARASGRPEFAVRAVVILTLKGAARDRSFGTELSLTLRGEIHDAVAQRHLASVGPLTKSRIGSAGCETSLCIEKETAPITQAIAARIGDEAGRELAQLTREPPLPQVAAAAGSRSSPVEPYSTGLITTYAIEFENFDFGEYLEITRIMQEEFPGFVDARDMQGTPNRGTWGYVSRAPDTKLYEWVNLMLIDLGKSPDHDVQVIKDGSTITLRHLFEQGEVR